MSALGIDINTKSIAWAIVSEGELLFSYIHWLDDKKSKEHRLFEANDLIYNCVVRDGGIKCAGVEVIPGRNSGNRGAQDINSLAAVCRMSVYQASPECEILEVINRSWMSKTCGFEGRKNPSKKMIETWVKGKYKVDIPLINDKWPSDINDAVAIADYTEQIYGLSSQ